MSDYEPGFGSSDFTGNLRLTKREYFAALAMQGIIADGRWSLKDAVRVSIDYADALIAELAKPKPEAKP